jgi:hypothetical protein
LRSFNKSAIKEMALICINRGRPDNDAGIVTTPIPKGAMRIARSLGGGLRRKQAALSELPRLRAFQTAVALIFCMHKK